MELKNFEGHYYTVTDEAITPTGKVEHYTAYTRFDATEKALYTHRLHNGRAWGTASGVVHCPSCGQIAIVEKPDQGQEQQAFELVKTEDGLQYTFDTASGKQLAFDF